MKKLAYLFSIVAIALSMGACTEDEPEFAPAQPVEKLPVFFSLEDKNEIELQESSTSIDVPVYRHDTEGELTVPVTVTIAPDAQGFTTPADVKFEAGAREATFSIALDMSKIKGRTDYSITMSIADGVETPYYTNKVTYKANFSPWETITGTDDSGATVTKALFRDDLASSMYGLDVPEYEVELQANPENKNVIRVVDPFGEIWPYLQMAQEQVGGFYDSSKHHYMYFNITNPNEVFLCDENGVALGYNGSELVFKSGLTINPAEGELYFTGEYNFSLANGQQPTPDLAGNIKQDNLTFGEKKLLSALSSDPTGFYYSNTNGLFRIIWPGKKPYADPSTTWYDLGKGLFTDGILYPIAFMEDPNEELPTYEVSVQQLGGDHNRYRIMNPWKKGICPYGVDYSGDKFIEINTTNPNCVLMDLQPTGLSFGQLGALYIMNYGSYIVGNGGTATDVISQGVNDIFKNGTVYSAPGNLLYGFPTPEGSISLNLGEFEWQYVMPEAAAGAPNKVSAKHFNGNGPLEFKSTTEHKNVGWAKVGPVFKESNKTLK